MVLNFLFEQWFTSVMEHEKKYTHFDAPFSIIKRKKALKQEFLDPCYVSKHPFYPFIGTSHVVVKFKGRKGKRIPKKKPRPICYAGHYDSLLLSWYSFILQKRYENVVKCMNFSESVIAYRKLTSKSSGKGLSNIDFANEIFQFISQKGECVSLTFDVENFFGTLDRSILKSKRKEVLGVKELPEDHFHIFKSLTNFQSIDKDVLIKELSRSSSRDKYQAKIKGYLYHVSDWEFLRQNLFKRGFIKSNEKDSKGVLHKKGIPQGSSMSAILSNIYMIDFDKRMTELAAINGALYRRYSDDITIICLLEQKSLFINSIYEEISKLQLVIQQEKEDRTIFQYDICGKLVGYYDMDDPKNKKRNSEGKYLCINKRNGDSVCHSKGCDFYSGRCKTILKKMQYLGFLFDGKEIEIRPGSMSNYRQRMITGVKKISYVVRGKKSKSTTLFKRKLIFKYTMHNGKAYSLSKNSQGEKKKGNNFISYAHRAFKITNSKRIKKQYKKHVIKLLKLIDRYS